MLQEEVEEMTGLNLPFEKVEFWGLLSEHISKTRSPLILLLYIYLYYFFMVLKFLQSKNISIVLRGWTYE